MSPRNRISVSTLASVATFVLLATVLALWPAEPAYAQDTTPNVAVITSTVKLASTTSSINIPIVLTTGTSEVGSAAFTLDYDESCIRIDNTSTDITGLPSTHLNSLVNNPVSGTLQISVWDQISPTAALETGSIAVVKFGLEPACRPPAGDTEIIFNFSDVSFGDTDSVLIEPSAVYSGTYTLEPNHTPTSLAFTATDMAENKSGSRKIGGLSASNNGDSDTLTYSMATTCSGTWSNEGFSVSGSDLNTVLPFDYDYGAKSYTVCVQVDDGRGGIVAATQELTVVAANDTPTEIELSSSTIYSGTPVLDAIGTFTTTDADAGDTFTYTLVSGNGDTNNALFDISGYTLTVSGTLTYPAQYKIRVQTEDGGGATYAQQFTLQALANAALALPGEPAVPFVVGTNSIAIPINYTANANSVITATFDVAYVSSCLAFTGLDGLQTGFAKTGSVEDVDGSVHVSLVVNTAGAVLHDGVIGNLNFTGKSDCALANSWTDLEFSNVSLKTHNDVGVSYNTPVNGKLTVVPDKNPGDCNSDGSVNAADFSATAREIWDVESEATGTTHLDKNSWLWSPLGNYAGSAKGCDSNEDRTLAVSDILCTARRFFGAGSCGAGVAAAASAPAVVAAPSAVLASANASVDVPISLETAGSNIAALAFAMNFDPAQFTFDASDADQDGVPDAVILNVPPSMLRMVDVTSGKLNIMVAGITMPMPQLSNGIVATIQLVGSNQAAGTLAPVTLTDVSLGDAEGGSVPAEVVSLTPEGLTPGLFLPVITR